MKEPLEMKIGYYYDEGLTIPVYMCIEADVRQLEAEFKKLREYYEARHTTSDHSEYKEALKKGIMDSGLFLEDYELELLIDIIMCINSQK